MLFLGLINLGVGYAQKKSLDHTVYDSWQSIKETVIQPQGNFVVYSITPQEGDGTLIIKNLKNGVEISIDRGTQPIFTNDGNYVVAKIKPKFADTRQAKIEKKKLDEMPKDSLVIINVPHSIVQKIASVKSYQLPEKGNGFVTYLKDKKGDFNKEGSELIIRNLNSGAEKSFPNINLYSVNSNALSVVLSQLKTKNTIARVILYNVSDSTEKTISKQFYSMTGFAWDETGNQLAYFVEKDSTDKSLQKNYTLAYYKNGQDTAEIVFEKTNPNIPKDYTVGVDHKLTFSKSGAVLEFGVQPILPIKDTSLPEFERVSIDIWHYADPILQPMQLKNMESILKSTETVLYRPKSNSISYLGKIKDRDIVTTFEGDGLYAYATVDSNYTIAFQWQGFSLKDIYAINTKNGEKKLVQKGWKGSLLSSNYEGNLLVFYDEALKQYKSYQTQTGIVKIIAKDINTILYDEDNDMPDDPNAYGMIKWMDNNSQFLLYDRYDIWLVDALGLKPSEKLTNGRKSKTMYRFVEIDADQKVIKQGSDLLLKGYNEIDKAESLAIVSLHSRKLFVINQQPMHFTTVVAAKKSNKLVMLQEDEIKSPNLYAYSIDTIKQLSLPISNINQQQLNYNWMTSQIVKWKSYTGKTAEGVLYLPENFDAQKKYPMIVYFYERNNQTLHNYLPPAPTPSRLNIPFFTSRGYVIFVPDIWYKNGYPGQGAYDYIVSGTRAMIQKGFIDSTKVGLQGQSWGGYQIAYLITKTNLYAAAWAGAPVVNMTSAYGGIRWGTGLNRQFQYEKTQSRIGASLWERPDLYIKNSPLFELPKVKTPLVIMSNDADDAVPWYQGIEMYTAMRRLDKKVWLLVYNNEAHNLIERRNRKDIQIREQQFFDSYLKGEPMPTWLKAGVPAVMKGRTWGLN